MLQTINKVVCAICLLSAVTSLVYKIGGVNVKRSTYFISSHSAAEKKNGEVITISCHEDSVINIIHTWTTSNGDSGVRHKCADEVYRFVKSECSGQQRCSFTVDNNICNASSQVYAVEVNNYQCRGYCPYMSHCDTVECTSKEDYWCTKCDEKLYYKVDDKECKDICSSRNRWCWPGTCNSSTLASDCKCMSGFTTIVNNNIARCQPTSKPEIQTCQTTAVAVDGAKILSHVGSSKCSSQKDFYGRSQVDHFMVDLGGVYEVIINNDLIKIRPDFVPNELFGVTDVLIYIFKHDIKGSKTLINQKVLKRNQWNPVRDFTETTNVTSNVTLKNAERLCLTYNLKGGGFLSSKDLESKTIVKIPFDKTETNKTLCYIHDTAPPEHCSERGSCKLEPLKLLTRLTSSGKLNAQFQGWIDSVPAGGESLLASGIESYALEVYEVIPSNLTLLMRDTSSVKRMITTNTSLDIELPRKNPMLYTILLEVKDFANNVRYARRFVLYDNTSVIAINNTSPLLVNTGFNKTKYKWQTNHGKLCYSWTDRYFNDHFKTNNHFRKIKTDTGISGKYDQNSGILPINGTINVNGLTRFNYSLIRNEKIVMSGQVENFTSESLCTYPDMVDGDEFTLQLQVTDMMNHTLSDSASVFIDRSVPEITDIWLTCDGTKQIYVHNSTDLSKIAIQFKVFDIHSGIREIKWAFGTYENRTLLIEKAVGVITVNKLSNSSVYCPKIGNCSYMQFEADLGKLASKNRHIGNHNRRYFFTIEAMNHAFLRAFEHIDILLDESPPEVGVVFEGPLGSQDIDYTSVDEITIHWHDFIDHESGIKQFKVALGNKCLNEAGHFDTDFQNGTIIFETVHTLAKLQFPGGEGQYFVSVVAYNNAMSPSKVVCSDGIIFDMTLPIISNFMVKHGKIKESVGCLNGTAWFIKDNLIKVALNSSLCTNLCRGKSDDVILKIIPSEIVTNTNKSDISQFICGNVMLYSRHVIYVPTDLLDLSWETFEDRSQISDIYIGFGKDRSTIDDPDIQGYIKVHHPSRYIQHHPGMLGFDGFYIFLRVINRARLETTVWIGPLIADETPPVCPTSLQPVVKGNKLVIEWTQAEVYDTEQSEEIGQVMFRFGTGNSFITPFLEWNLKNHNGDCRAKNQCIKYPVKRLQKYNSNDGSAFYAQLHFYNYAGHFCSITTLPFHLPYLFPPRAGLVLDVLANCESTYQDVDYIIDSNQFCVAWTGFDHHVNVQLQLGLGTSPELDDSIPFHSIPSNMTNLVCQDFRFNTRQYFATIKASCSGGTTLSSSDGFVVLDEASVLTSLSVYHGEKCNNLVEFELINKQSNIEIQTKKPLMFGRTFSIFTPANITLNDPNILAMESRMLSGFYVFTFMPLNDIEILNITSPKETVNYFNKTNTYLYQCNPLQKAKISDTFIPVHWTLDSNFSEIHYKTALCTYIDGKCQNDLVYQHAGRSTSYNFTGNFASSSYKVFVKPCFGQICLSSVSSETFVVEYTPISPISFSAKATVHGLRLNVSLTIKKYLCYMNESAPVYRWAVYTDGDGFRQVSDLKYVVDEPVKMQGVSWIDTNILPYKISFVCVEPVCSTGIMPKHCSPIEFISDPNTFEKNIIYDLNLNDIFTKDLLKFRYTANVGSKLRLLQDSELEFTDPNVKIGGLIIGRPTMKITWYLTSKRDVPSSLCSIDDSCLHSLNTTGGFVDFNNPFIKTDRIFYICAASSEFRLCSNGFLVDSSYPHAGIVSIDTFNGYVIDGSHLAVTWKGFTGNKDAVKLGYLSDIAGYQYAVGTSKGTNDVLPFTSVGLSEAVIIEGLHLKPGRAYYASVRAFNHMNHTVDAVSNHVIYDPSPPSSGVIEVEDSFYGYVAAQTLSLRWFGIEDRESGINRIEIGIGSHNNSADVLPFREYLDAVTINTGGVIHDGHTYYAILRATNGAGHQSYTGSLPFIIDSSPPSVGHVMETSQGENVKKDIDYQTDSNSVSISWFGFYDPHSKLSFYKVALGTTPRDDDIFPYTNVGLQTTTTWKFDFTHGVRYYTSVMACNGVELCSIATSNGVIIDTSPPVPGLVVVGDPGRHSRYQSNRKAVRATWVGFQDPHSGLDHFEFCVGTSELSCDVANLTDVQMRSSILKSDLNMADGVPHYVTIIACNKVKMCIQRSSERFIVDQTPPSVLKKPYIDNVHMEKYNGRYVISDPSFLKVMWKYNDDKSPIVRTSISVISEIDSHIPLDDVIVSANSDYTIHLSRNESLRQGDVYKIKVTACNAADLCTTSFSDEILVDSSPPQIGGFKLPMWYKLINESIVFHISWYGFFDSQSGIRSYHLSIGSGYSSRDVVDNLMVMPNGTDDTESVEVKALNQDLPPFVILSLWAVNNAGLATLETKVTVDVAPTASDLSHGSLIIQMHSCALNFCRDKCTLCDCTCSIIGKKCSPRQNHECTKTSKPERNPLLSIDISMRTIDSAKLISTSSTCLSVNWTFSPITVSILKFEYSFGRNGSDIGEGIYNLSVESQWHDVGSRQKAFHCLHSGELSHGTYYVAYVRAWLSQETYVTTTSLPLRIDHTPPVIHKHHPVTDSIIQCGEDVDYITSNYTIYGCWDGVFSDDESSIIDFIVSLGTTPGVDDIVSMTKIGVMSQITWTGIYIEPGTRYYTNVIAVNAIGLQTGVSSDGFLLDDKAPKEGVIFNTRLHKNRMYQSVKEPLFFSWHGFNDEHSSIRSYMIAFEVNNSGLNRFKSFKFIEIGNLNHFLYPVELLHGDAITARIKATDAAGHESLIVASQPLRIDGTHPGSFECVTFDLIKQSYYNISHSHYVISESISSKQNDVLKIKVMVDKVESNFVTYILINDMTMVLPFEKNADESVVSDYNYLVEKNGVVNIFLQFYEIKRGASAYVEISACSTMRIDKKVHDAVTAQQISQNEISVCIQALDIESGIRRISVGVGSIPSGKEILAMRSFPLHQHDVIKGNFSHGMTIFITSKAENHAGLTSYFKSKPFVFDMTPPVIAKGLVTETYVYQQNDTLTVITARWAVKDPESGIKFCSFCIGSSLKSCDILENTKTRTLEDLRSHPLQLPHGSKVYTTVQCVNRVELMGTAHFDPLIVSYLPPLSESHVNVIDESTANSCSDGHSQFISFTWDGFKDLSEINTYSVEFYREYTKIVEWTNISTKNYIRLRNFGVHDEEQYTLLVRAINYGGCSSETIKRTANVDCRIPLLTGSRIEILRFGNNDYRLCWENVFQKHPQVAAFKISVGSDDGYTDLSTTTGVKTTSLEIELPKNVNEVYVILTAYTPTGQSLTYRQSIIMQDWSDLVLTTRDRD